VQPCGTPGFYLPERGVVNGDEFSIKNDSFSGPEVVRAVLLGRALQGLGGDPQTEVLCV
jgi:hypothetical protein